MPAPFPHTYNVNLQWEEAAQGTSSFDAEGPSLKVGPPTQFDGPGDVWSPEDMLLNAIQTCLMTTFFSLVNRRPFAVHRFDCDIEGTLDKTSEGLQFTRIHMNVSVDAEDVEKAERLLHQAEKYCIISNALKARPTMDVHVTNSAA